MDKLICFFYTLGFCVPSPKSRLTTLTGATLSLGRKLTLAIGMVSILSLGTINVAFAGIANVIDVQIEALGGGKFRVNATLEHADTGWDHYANRWDVLDENNNVIGVRELLHPHVNEQPFTRSLTLTIEPSVKTITVQANDSEHGLGGDTMSIAVPH